MRLALLGSAALLASGACLAGGLDDLRDTLRPFSGTAPVKATVVRAVTSERKDQPLEAGRVTLYVSDGPAGITIRHPPELLAQIRAERAQTDPDQPRPVRRTLMDFDAIDVADLLNRATGLLSDLDGASLRAERVESWQGRPARVIEVSIPPRVSRANRRWLKSATHTLKLWLDDDGVPLASESSFDFVVGLLLFTFEARDLRTHEYQRVGDRLVTRRLVAVFDGEGLGESQHTHAETTLHLEPGA